jgi:hypothetical protein
LSLCNEKLVSKFVFKFNLYCCIAGAIGTNGDAPGLKATSKWVGIVLSAYVGVQTNWDVECTVTGSKKLAPLRFTTRMTPCVKGYVLSADFTRCVKCAKGTLSTVSEGLYHNGTNQLAECEPCPFNGYCPGGHVGGAIQVEFS